MNNKERYKRAFNVLQTSKEICLEDNRVMNFKEKMRIKVAAAAIIGISLTGSAVTAYAMDLGGVRGMIDAWIHGEEKAVEYQIDENNEFSIYDETGEIVVGTINSSSKGIEDVERAVTAPTIEFAQDGKRWIYYYDEKIDITDSFVDQKCYITLYHEDNPLYVVVYDSGDFTTSPYEYAEMELDTVDCTDVNEYVQKKKDWLDHIAESYSCEECGTKGTWYVDENTIVIQVNRGPEVSVESTENDDVFGNYIFNTIKTESGLKDIKLRLYYINGEGSVGYDHIFE